MIHTYIHTYIRMYIHTYVCIYIHTYIRIYIHPKKKFIHTYRPLAPIRTRNHELFLILMPTGSRCTCIRAERVKQKCWRFVQKKKISEVDFIMLFYYLLIRRMVSLPIPDFWELSQGIFFFAIIIIIIVLLYLFLLLTFDCFCQGTPGVWSSVSSRSVQGVPH